MFIPKKEKVIITIEAIIYVLLVVLASYFTINGNIFLRMVPMIYLLGIFGIILFDKPIVTVILSGISTFVFGYLTESEINSTIFAFTIYSTLMIILGSVTGQVLNTLYENYKLRKFIKYYHKIIYIFVLIACILVPLFLNNMVNGNMISYSIAKKEISKYINDNYVFSEYYIEDIRYNKGMYEFMASIDGIDVKLNYSFLEKVLDGNMKNRIEKLNKSLNAEMNILLKENRLTELDVKCIYGYSKIATMPDVIRMNVVNVKKTQLDKVIVFLETITKWNKYDIVDRIDIAIEGKTVSILKKDLGKKEITKEYILNGMKQEILDSKEDR